MSFSRAGRRGGRMCRTRGAEKKKIHNLNANVFTARRLSGSRDGARAAATEPRWRASSTLCPISILLPCQGSFHPLKHTHRKTNTLILDRYTLISYICSPPPTPTPTSGPSGAERRPRDGLGETFPKKAVDCFTKVHFVLF